MKRIGALILTFALALCTSAGLSAHHSCQKGDWKKKMQSEKIAFLTLEMDLSPEEAQAFWPVYNKMEGKMDQAMHKVFDSFKALDEALKAGKPEKEIKKLLDNYQAAQKDHKETDADRVEEYLKVLPANKVARLFIGEENFRRNHIRRLHDRRIGN